MNKDKETSIVLVVRKGNRPERFLYSIKKRVGLAWSLTGAKLFAPWDKGLIEKYKTGLIKKGYTVTEKTIAIVRPYPSAELEIVSEFIKVKQGLKESMSKENFNPDEYLQNVISHRDKNLGIDGENSIRIGYMFNGQFELLVEIESLTESKAKEIFDILDESSNSGKLPYMRVLLIDPNGNEIDEGNINQKYK